MTVRGVLFCGALEPLRLAALIICNMRVISIGFMASGNTRFSCSSSCDSNLSYSSSVALCFASCLNLASASCAANSGLDISCEMRPAVMPSAAATATGSMPLDSNSSARDSLMDSVLLMLLYYQDCRAGNVGIAGPINIILILFIRFL